MDNELARELQNYIQVFNSGDYEASTEIWSNASPELSDEILRFHGNDVELIPEETEPKEQALYNREFCWGHEGPGLGGWQCKHEECLATATPL